MLHETMTEIIYTAAKRRQFDINWKWCRQA